MNHRVTDVLLALAVFAAFVLVLCNVGCDVIPDDYTSTPPSCPSGLAGWPHCPCRHGYQCVDEATYCGPATVCVYAVPVGR
jgi:hypothetical protein